MISSSGLEFLYLRSRSTPGTVWRVRGSLWETIDPVCSVSSNSKMQGHFPEETLNAFVSFSKGSVTRRTLTTPVLGPCLLQEALNTCRRKFKYHSVPKAWNLSQSLAVVGS